jgi:SP family sugar:H+ symporter-like MFS transporter
MGKFTVPKFDAKKWGLSSHVHYDEFNPSLNTEGAKGNLNNLDYSPLRRITGQSILLAVVVSMGGFL